MFVTFFKVSKSLKLRIFYSIWAMSMKKIISKIEYSEWVLRSSFYWISAVTRWKLVEDEEHWIVSFERWDDEVEFEFERLLNDYKLREKLEAHTGQVRTSIIDNVLRSVDSRLSQ